MDRANGYIQGYRRIVAYDRPQIIASLTRNNIRYNPNLSTDRLRAKLVAIAERRFNKNTRNNRRNVNQYQMEVEFYVNEMGEIKKAHDRAHSYIVNLQERIADKLKNQTIHLDSKLYQTLREINEPDLNTTLDNLESVLDHVEVIRLEPHVAGGGFDVLNEMFFNDDNKCISSKYTENVLDYINRQWTTKYSSDYISKYYREKACLYTVIIDTYKSKFAKCPRFRNDKLVSDLTYENLYHIIHGVYPTESPDGVKSSWGLSLNMIVSKFFGPYKLGLKVLDIRGNILHSYTPDSPTKVISPNPLYILAHNKHIYKMCKSANDMKSLNLNPTAKVNVKPPPANYNIPKQQPGKCEVEFSNSFQEIVDWLKEDSIKGGVKKLIYTDEIYTLLQHCLTAGYEPHISIDSAKCVTSLKIRSANDIEYTIRKLRFEEIAGLEFGDLNYLRKYLDQHKKIEKNLLNYTNLSYYSNTVSEAIQKFPRGAISGYFGDYTTPDFSIDFCKQYTSMLLKISKFPVFSCFDEVSPYDGTLHPDRFYVVKINHKNNLDLIIENKETSLISGFAVKHLTDYEILAQITPSKYVRNEMSVHVDQLYASDLLPRHRKDIMNSVIGNTRKLVNKFLKCNIYSDANECGLHYDKSVNVEMNGTTYFLGYESSRQELSSGYYFISLLIYDLSRIALKQLASALIDSGYPVCGVNTDSVFSKGIPLNEYEDNDKFGRTKFEKVEVNEMNTVKEFGKIRMELKRLPRVQISSIKCEDTHLSINEGVKTNIIVPFHEADYLSPAYADEMLQLLKLNNVQVNALYPGSGKTTSYKKIHGVDGINVLFVAPHNALKQDLIRDGCNAVTLNALMGLGVTDDITFTKVDVIPYTHIVFDEVKLCSVRQLQYIHRFMASNPTKFFGATCDGFQNQPIEEDYKYPRQYYDYIVNKLFPNIISLSIPKRVRREDREAFCELFDKLKQGDSHHARKIVREMFPPRDISTWVPDDTPNVVYLNNTAAILNAKFPSIETLGNHVALCKQHLVIGEGKSKFTCYTNTLYSIAYHTPTKIGVREYDPLTPNAPYIWLPITRKNERGEKIATALGPLETYRKYFAPPHSRTCYSLQGLTIGPKINIFDTALPLVDKHWLITALSRATTLDIRVYNNPVCMPSDLKKRVERYMEQDTDRFGADALTPYIDQYITPAWLLARLCDARCMYCRDDIGSTWTVDRLDNALPHTITNCVLACSHCNCAKK